MNSPSPLPYTDSEMDHVNCGGMIKVLSRNFSTTIASIVARKNGDRSYVASCALPSRVSSQSLTFVFFLHFRLVLGILCLVLVIVQNAYIMYIFSVTNFQYAFPSGTETLTHAFNPSSYSFAFSQRRRFFDVSSP